jgi:DNA-binding NarL/FixJ family response regulator
MLKVLIETQPDWEVCGEAENGEEAISKVLEHRPDVVVMDMAMPVRDGISASREISQKAPNTPIVMHTLHYSTELEVEAKKAGVVAVVPKAEASDELIKTIEKVLRRSENGTSAGNDQATENGMAIGVESLAGQQPNRTREQSSGDQTVVQSEGSARSRADS